MENIKNETELLKNLLKNTEPINVNIDNIEVIQHKRYDVKSKQAQAYRSKIKQEVLELLDDDWVTKDIVKHICSKYNYKRRQALNYVRQAEEIIVKNSNNYARKLVIKFDKIYRKSMEEHRYSDANKALEQIGKILGAYTEKIQYSIDKPIVIQMGDIINPEDAE